MTSSPRGPHLKNNTEGKAAPKTDAADYDTDFEQLFATDLNEDNYPADDWLMSYTDIATLLITLFVVLLAHSTFNAAAEQDKEAAEQTPEIIVQSDIPDSRSNQNLPQGTIGTDLLQGEDSILSADSLHSANVHTPNNVIAIPEKNPFEIQKETAERPQDAQDKLDAAARREEANNLQDTLAEAGLGDQVEINVSSEHIEIRMNESVLFASADDSLFNEAQSILNTILPILEKSDYQIAVEGHTDNRPIATARFPSNWELSAARAVSVINYLQRSGLPADRMHAIAYGETQPIETNDTAEGRQKNRRVQLILK